MTKFCFVLPSFFFENKGGSEIQCYYLAKELLSLGHEVHYIRETNSPFRKKENIAGIILHSVFNFKLLPKLLFLQYFVRNLYLKIIMEEIRADYWYVRSDDTYLPFIDKIRTREKSKLIWACSSDSKVEKDYWKTWFGLKVQNSIIKSLENADIIFQTKYQQNTFKKNYNMQGIVIYNSHPVPEFPKYKDKNIIWLGNLKEVKRPKLFLDLVNNMRDTDYKFLMIGRNNKNKYSKYIKRTEKMCENFEYLGELNIKEVYDILNRAKLLINTSRFEGFSNTFIEAWLRGVPVFSISVDPDDFIKNNNLGIVSSDLNNLKKNIIKFLGNTEELDLFSKNVYDYATIHFDIKKNVKELLEFIKKQNHK